MLASRGLEADVADDERADGEWSKSDEDEATSRDTTRSERDKRKGPEDGNDEDDEAVVFFRRGWGRCLGCWGGSRNGSSATSSSSSTSSSSWSLLSRFNTNDDTPFPLRLLLFESARVCRRRRWRLSFATLRAALNVPEAAALSAETVDDVPKGPVILLEGDEPPRGDVTKGAYSGRGMPRPLGRQKSAAWNYLTKERGLGLMRPHGADRGRAMGKDRTRTRHGAAV